MCTGLVTVAPFFGSMKNTRTFLPPSSCLGAGEDAESGHHHERSGSTSCLLIFIQRSPFRGHILAAFAPRTRSRARAVRRETDVRTSEPRRRGVEPAGRRLERQDARGDRGGERLVRGQRRRSRTPRRRGDRRGSPPPKAAALRRGPAPALACSSSRIAGSSASARPSRTRSAPAGPSSATGRVQRRLRQTHLARQRFGAHPHRRRAAARSRA